MKKILSALLVCVLLAACVLTLASCGNKGDAIKKAFEKNGYTVTTASGSDESVQGIIALLDLTDDQKKEIGNYEIILCKPESDGSILGAVAGYAKMAIVVKFPSDKDVKDFYTVETEDGTDTSAYDSAKNNGTVNGNCIILTISKDAINIFKNA